MTESAEKFARERVLAGIRLRHRYRFRNHGFQLRNTPLVPCRRYLIDYLASAKNVHIRHAGHKLRESADNRSVQRQAPKYRDEIVPVIARPGAHERLYQLNFKTLSARPGHECQACVG